MSAEKSMILVTGGGGFLGGAIVRALLEKGYKVRSFSRNEHPRLKESGVETARGDLADQEAVINASAGCSAVIHSAARVGFGVDYQEFYRGNVIGTKNVIIACLRNNIDRLIFTGSPSVVFDGGDQENVNESAPYPAHFLGHYQSTKAQAEKLALDANSDKLAVVSLRPHLIWGPGDTNMIPRVVERARQGKVMIVGDGQNLVDITYIDNAADAHVLALEKLHPGADISGKAYFITNGEPMAVGDIFNRIVNAAGLSPKVINIPLPIAYAMGALAEFVYGILKKKEEPKITRFIAKEMAHAHWFDISAARKELGYEPRVSIDRGMEKLREWLSATGGSSDGK